MNYFKTCKHTSTLFTLLHESDKINMVIVMNLFEIILIIIIIASLLIIMYATIYNNLVSYKLKIEKAEGIIDESLRKKYDIICKLNIPIKKVVTKKDYLKEYIDLKEKRISNYELDRKLTEAHNIILEVKNDHEKLDAKEFNKSLKEIDKLNETLTSSKIYYNKNTGELNKLIRKFPTNIIAKIHGYKIKPFFDGKNMQDAVIDDFKL